MTQQAMTTCQRCPATYLSAISRDNTARWACFSTTELAAALCGAVEDELEWLRRELDDLKAREPGRKGSD
jgi:hypothetical protein